jgi:hypothetical protein
MTGRNTTIVILVVLLCIALGGVGILGWKAIDAKKHAESNQQSINTLIQALATAGVFENGEVEGTIQINKVIVESADEDQ